MRVSGRKRPKVVAMALDRPVTLAIQRFDRTAALHTGKVSIRNVTVMYVPAGTGVAGLMGGVFDGHMVHDRQWHSLLTGAS